ncbi:MAG: hypothetical protein OIF38_16610, partial [Cellvibrionaceae bacterium]|nr:hypothetical protein [Cellvibrionaceae bacterium]
MGPNKLRYKKVATYTGLMLLGLLGACSSSLQVKGQFPTPLVQPLPLHAGLYLSPELRGHSYQEQDKERHEWAISTGAAQSAFFSTVLPALFENFKLFEQEPGTDSGVDIVIRPHLKSFQYSLPRETRSKVFEVWMKYNMQVYRGDGELLADW